eukprot:gnl/TRDRNA2_/TRDRNA2_176058_c0_seq1.p1 gnl/TRDRNA2_/TRDRNA2_176058_c0~~gnl/TRDRNA2_/TRDRNA2_176058_c0_seq1.p1  ORF type:complete len:382 (+),score=85.25 gnl/TRDRNA2_/TRDRNA2_176058_c0_seq1:84-1148(+)
MERKISSPLCDLLKIEHPIILAGMAVVASPPLAAAVSNAGGLGVIGAGFPEPSPKLLRKMIAELKELLQDKTAFGVDLLIPQVGGGARKTNYDYTKGALPEMIDIICESGCRLFVCAIGVPPKWMTEKLHSSGIVVMNMVGSPKHVPKALDAGVDIICAQGYEGGGHTGDVATMVLVPQAVDLCRGKTSPLTGGPVHVVAAGGMYNGRTLAAALALGAQGVWVGTRFLASDEATATKLHKQSMLTAGAEDTIRTVIYTGRPARMLKTPYVLEWEQKRKTEIEELTGKGIVPHSYELSRMQKAGTPLSFAKTSGISFGQAVGGIKEIQPAKDIIKDMVAEAAAALQAGGSRVAKL